MKGNEVQSKELFVGSVFLSLCASVLLFQEPARARASVDLMGYAVYGNSARLTFHPMREPFAAAPVDFLNTDVTKTDAGRSQMNRSEAVMCVLYLHKPRA